MRTLVVGATGLLGTSICARLREQGLPVRGLVREGSTREALLAGMGVEITHGDLKAPASLDKACHQVEAVVSTATSIISRGPGDSLKRVDRDGQLSLLQAAQQAGVRRYLFVSASIPPELNSPFFSYKRQVEKALRASALRWTILQPTAFMETSFSSAVGWDIAARKAHLFGSGIQPISYISREDVASIASLALTRPSMEQRCLPLGGPEALSPLQAVRIFEKAAGQRFTIRRTPVWVLQGLRTLVRPFNPRLSSLMALGLAAARGGVIDMTQFRAEFGALPALTFLDEFARICAQAEIQRA